MIKKRQGNKFYVPLSLFVFREEHMFAFFRQNVIIVCKSLLWYIMINIIPV